MAHGYSILVSLTGLKSLEVDLVPVSEDVVEGDDYTFTCEANAENIHTDVSFVVLIDAKHSGNDFDRYIIVLVLAGEIVL